MPEEKIKMLYFSLRNTFDANEKRPFKLLINSLSKVPLLESKNFGVQYFLALCLVALIEKKEIENFSFPKEGCSFRDIVRFYFQLLDAQSKIIPAGKDIFDFHLVQDNINYFKNRNDWWIE